MTELPDPVPPAAAPGAPTRVLIVYYSNSGDVVEALSTLVEPLSRSADTRITWVKLEPSAELTFPARLRDLFNTAPETIGSALLDLPMPDANWEAPYDLVILGWQVWWLRPSAPVRAFLASPCAEVLRDRRVLLVGCSRQMWISAFQRLQRRIEELGGQICDNIMLRYEGAGMTLLSTPLKLLTGRREIKGLPMARLRPDELEALRVCGGMLARDRESWASPGRKPRFGELAPAYGHRKYRAPEQVGSLYMSLWRAIFVPAVCRRPWARWPLVWLWALGFAIGLVLVVPIWALLWTALAWPLAGKRGKTWRPCPVPI